MTVISLECSIYVVSAEGQILLLLRRRGQIFVFMHPLVQLAGPLSLLAAGFGCMMWRVVVDRATHRPFTPAGMKWRTRWSAGVRAGQEFIAGSE